MIQVLILHDLFEEVKTEEAFAYGVVAVYAGSELFLAVVQVDGAQVIHSNLIVKLFPDALVGVFKVVAGGVRMTGVDAHSHAGFIGHTVNDTLYLPECKTYVGALSCGVLDYGSYAAGLFKSAIRSMHSSGVICLR